jgi:glycosyltransferase involved in cell wall biosynthesis
MVIELVGLPGAGKSTFARKLAEDKRFVIVAPTGKMPLLWWNLRFFLRFPMRSVVLAYFLLRYLGPRSYAYEKITNLFFVHNAKYMKARTVDRAIIDQGHHQAVVSLFESIQDIEIIRRFLRYIPKPDLLIVFDIPHNIREERMGRRGYRVRAGLPSDVRERWERAFLANYSAFLDLCVSAEHPLKFVRSDADAEKLISMLTSKRSMIYILNSRMPTEKAHGNQVATMCNEFAKLGIAVELWAPMRENPIKTDLYTYYNVPHSFEFRRIRTRGCALRRFFPKLAFYVDGFWFLVALFGIRVPRDTIVYTRKPEVAWLMALKRNKVVYECHEWFAHYQWGQFLLMRGAYRLVATNRFIADEFIKRGFPKDRVVVAPNGVDIATFAIDVTKRDAVKDLGLSEIIPDILTRRVLMYTGKLTTMGEDKGVADILRAVERMKNPKILFISVGGTEEENRRYEKLAHELALDRQVRFLGNQSKQRLALFQRVADVLLMPFPKKAHYEYFMSPLKTFEYMASGRPIIASDLPSIREVLSEHTAVFCEPGNPASIIEAIKKIEDRRLSQAIAQNARKAAEGYSWSSRAWVLVQSLYP